MSRTPAYNDKKSYRHQPSMQTPLASLVAMEGKTAACAHLSALDNIAAATYNWNNEAAQNVSSWEAWLPPVSPSNSSTIAGSRKSHVE